MSDVARWVFPLRTEGPFEADLDDSRIKYVRATDYERDVAAAEVRGWNAAVEGVISACQADWRFEDHNDWYLAAVAALRKPTEAQT